MSDPVATDLVRLVIFGLFGVGVAFMCVTNIIAAMVLRPPKKLGFLWWHVTSISIAFLCLGTVAIERVTGRWGYPATWRTWVTLVGIILFSASQFVIFNVERQRLMYNRAAEQMATHVG